MSLSRRNAAASPTVPRITFVELVQNIPVAVGTMFPLISLDHLPPDLQPDVIFADPLDPGSAELLSNKPENSGKPQVQLWWNARRPRIMEAAMRLVPDPCGPLQLIDGHATTLFANRKPDELLLANRGRMIHFSFLVCIGDLKKRRMSVDEFNDDELAHLADLLVSLLFEQSRRSIVGYLTDGKIIQFMQMDLNVELSHIDTIVVTHPMLMVADGGVALLSLLACNATILHWNLPALDLVKKHEALAALCAVGGELGGGGSCRAFSVNCNGAEDLVLKVYDDPHALANEILVLEHLKSFNVGRVPQIVASGQSQLLVSPLGHKFRTEPVETGDEVEVAMGLKAGARFPTFGDLSQILSTIQEIHQAGIVHRDLKFDNVYQASAFFVSFG